jgi:hypothetical protein
LLRDPTWTLLPKSFSLASPAWVIGASLFKGDYYTDGRAIVGADGNGIDPDVGNAGAAPTSSPGGPGTVAQDVGW